MKTLKNITKKILIVLITLATILVPTAKVNADNYQTIQLGDAQETKAYLAGVKFFYKNTVDGEELFCLNIVKKTAKNTTATLVTEGKTIDGGIAYILRNGYPYVSMTGDKDKDYYITQTAVWWYLDLLTGSENLGEQFKEEAADPHNIRPLVRNLAYAGYEHRNDPLEQDGDEKLELTTEDVKMTLQDGNFVSKDIRAETQHVDSYNVSLTGAPSGTKIIKSDGTEFTYNGEFNLKSNESFKISVSSSSLTGIEENIKVSAYGNSEVRYLAYEYKPADNEMQNIAILRRKSIRLTAELNLKIESSKVTILKIDAATNQPLAGAKLVLKDSEGNVLGRWTSTTNGYIIRNLAAGTYTVEEEEAPKGYELDRNPVEFTVSDSQKDIKVTFKNTAKKVVVTISKIDQETRTQLAGAVIVIKDANGNEIKRFTSTNEAYVLTGIEYGTYTVYEESAPEGYIKSDEVFTITIDEEHRSHQIVIKNAREVFVPDTASKASIIMTLLGISILLAGMKYVRNHRTNEN